MENEFFFSKLNFGFSKSFCKVCQIWFDHFLNLFGEFCSAHFNPQVCICKIHQFGLINDKMSVSFDSVLLRYFETFVNEQFLLLFYD